MEMYNQVNNCLSFAFDIETTGLNPEIHAVTCICVCGEGFERCWMPLQDGRPESFFEMMDAADFLVAFNGVKFDLNFLQCVYSLSNERVGKWVLKLRDSYEASYLAFKKTFSLNRFLEVNDLQSKISCGAEAVVMANEGRWDDLREYCMADAALAWISMRTGVFKLPFAGFSSLDVVNWRCN